MRLSIQTIKYIKQTFKEVFGDGDIYLFGSRVDDTKRGGDIDLFIDLKEVLTSKERIEKKLKFLRELKDKIGEQKIDIVISKDKNSTIEKEALKTGVKL